MVVCYFGETIDESWDKELFWLKDKIVGEPQPTTVCTKEQLIQMNLVGIYKEGD